MAKPIEFIPQEEARQQAHPGERVLDVWARQYPGIPVLWLFAQGFKAGMGNIRRIK